MKRLILALMASSCLMTGCSKTVSYTEDSMKNRSEADQIINNTDKNKEKETEVATDNTVTVSNDSEKYGDAAKIKEVVEEKVENKAIEDEAKKQEIIEGVQAKMLEPFDDYSVNASASVEIIVLDKETNNNSLRYIADSIAERKMSREASYSKVDLQSSAAGVKSYIHSVNYLIDTGERTLSYFKSYDEGIKDSKAEWKGAVVDRDLETEERTLSNIAENMSFDVVKVGTEKLDGTERYTLTAFYNLYNAMSLIGVPSNVHNVFEDDSADYKATIKLYIDESDYSVVRYDISATKALEAYYDDMYNKIEETVAEGSEETSEGEEETVAETQASKKSKKKDAETEAETEVAEEVIVKPNINAEVLRCKGTFDIDTKSKVSITVDPEITDMIANDGQRKLEEISKVTSEDSLGLNVDSDFGVGANSEDESKADVTESKAEVTESKATVTESKAEVTESKTAVNGDTKTEESKPAKKVLKPKT